MNTSLLARFPDTRAMFPAFMATPGQDHRHLGAARAFPEWRRFRRWCQRSIGVPIYSGGSATLPGTLARSSETARVMPVSRGQPVGRPESRPRRYDADVTPPRVRAGTTAPRAPARPAAPMSVVECPRAGCVPWVGPGDRGIRQASWLSHASRGQGHAPGAQAAFK